MIPDTDDFKWVQMSEIKNRNIRISMVDFNEKQLKVNAILNDSHNIY